jgi:signal transduction histidine kinase
MKIKTRIALVFTLMTATILLLLSVVVYVLSLNHSHEYFFTRLKTRASIAAERRFMNDKANDSFVAGLRERHLLKLPREREYFFDADSSLHQQLDQILPSVPSSFLDDLEGRGSAAYHIGFQHFIGISYSAKDKNYLVVVSAYDENAADEIGFLGNLLLFGFLSSTVLVFVLGQFYANRFMRPIMEIINRVNLITATNLHERLTHSSKQDELTAIVNTFNAMLDRLETAFELQGHFISNASHELRTPLTAILGEAEITLQSRRDPEYYVRSIKTMQLEATRLDDLTSSLLRLSQISYDGQKQKIEPVLMDELLMSIKIGFDQRMPNNQLRVLVQELPDQPEVFGLVCARGWMELALTNIINNSIKYSDNKEVLVSLSAGDGQFFIQVSDYGIGIPTEEIKHVFEPFFRGSNTSRYTGYGIGLPLVGKIIRLHGGKITILSKPGMGTKVTLTFPQSLKLKSD